MVNVVIFFLKTKNNRNTEKDKKKDHDKGKLTKN